MTDKPVAPESTPQSKPTELTYEQSVHASLWAAKTNTEGLIEYLSAQAKAESGDARKLTEKCIAWKREQLRDIVALIPQALERRESTPTPQADAPPQFERLREFISSVNEWAAKFPLREPASQEDRDTSATIYCFCEGAEENLYELKELWAAPLAIDRTDAGEPPVQVAIRLAKELGQSQGRIAELEAEIKRKDEAMICAIRCIKRNSTPAQKEWTIEHIEAALASPKPAKEK